MKPKKLLAVEAMKVETDRLFEAAERIGVELVVLAEHPSKYQCSTSSGIVEFPTGELDSIRAFVAEHRSEIAGIISPTDKWGPSAAALAAENGFPVNHPPEHLALLRDKRWIKEQVSRLGEDDANDLPAIVKPRRGTGSIGVRCVEDRKKLDEVLVSLGERREEYTVEKFHFGPVYSAEVYCDSGSTLFIGVTNRVLTAQPEFLERVKTFPHAPDTEWERQVQKWATDVLECVRYRQGFAHIEFVETSNGFRLIDLNARVPGALIAPAINRTSNVNPYDLIVADGVGIRAAAPAGRALDKGHSHVSVYAHKKGVLQRVDGLDRLVEYPGEVGWIGNMGIGSSITNLGDYRARIGNVYAVRDSPELAQDTAISAALGVRAEIV